MNHPKKPYWEMDLEELRDATREYDKEMPGVPGKPLTRIANCSRGRASAGVLVGKGAEKMRISVERDSQKQADAAARRLKVTRSELIAPGLRRILKQAG